MIYSLLRFVVSSIAVSSVIADGAAATTGGDERPPTMFKGPGDEWLALPEVFSVLDFAAANAPAAEDDIEGQESLRASRFWGRLYIDGWPQSVQFFRAHFGKEPPLGRKRFVFAEPRDACTELTNAAHLTSDHVVLVNRGTCTFGTKALIVSKTNAASVVIINNEPGLDHLPGPDAHDIDFSIVSIGQQEGQNLESFYDEGVKDSITGFGQDMSGHVIPINCENSGARCVPATYAERVVVSGMNEGGIIELSQSKGAKGGLPASELPLEYLLAHFGTKVPSSADGFAIALAKPAEACTALENNVKGKIVLVRRGSCPFIKKVENVEAAGGSVVVLGSTTPYLLRMGVEPRWKGLNTAIAVAMVSKRVYGILLAESYAGTTAALREQTSVNASAWETLEQFSNGQGWPRSNAFLEKKYETLAAEYAPWPDRAAAISDAHAKQKERMAASGEDATAGAGGEL